MLIDLYGKISQYLIQNYTKRNGDCVQPWKINREFVDAQCGVTHQIFQTLSTKNQSSHATFYNNQEWPLVASRKLQI